MINDLKFYRPDLNLTLNLSMDKTNDYILGEGTTDLGTVVVERKTYKFVNQIGEYLENSQVGSRSISVVGWIIANSDKQMTERKSFLNKFFNPTKEIYLYYKNYQLNFYPDSSVQYGISVQENNEVICNFKFTGYCPDPLFKDKAESQKSTYEVISKFTFPFVIKPVVFGEIQKTDFLHIENSGHMETGMQIIFEAQRSVLNPKITNVETLEFIKINKELQSGEKIIINTEDGQKRILGYLPDNDEAIKYYVYKDFDSTWLKLNIGENNFLISADSGVENLVCTIIYKNKYMEVQECD